MRAMAPLDDEEKTAVVVAYRALREAIDRGDGEDDLMPLAADFQRAYRGDARPLIDAYGTAPDKIAWARQVYAALAEEIEPAVWARTWLAALEHDGRTDPTGTEP